MTAPLGLFLITAPGLEAFLADEAREQGFEVTGTVPGGVSVSGGWHDVARANRGLRGAVRVLARVGEFRALHLAQLDKRSRKLDWAAWLRSDIPVRVEAVCRKSRIYHNKAAAQRVARAIAETVGAPVSAEAEIVIKVRIEDDLCTISLDTSGESLHKRGLKQQVNKAPMRETMAALFLRACGYVGQEPVFDPMCGSGTFPIEAAEMALGLAPGRARAFAYQKLAVSVEAVENRAEKSSELRFFGSDRDQGAVAMAQANAKRAGVAEVTEFACRPISDCVPPCEASGLVIANPPYGGRVGNSKPLYGLYASFGAVMQARFQGWRVGLITSEAGLAKATGLPGFEPGPVVNHGGIKVRLWQSGVLT